jgi:hypothetical protein
LRFFRFNYKDAALRYSFTAHQCAVRKHNKRESASVKHSCLSRLGLVVQQLLLQLQLDVAQRS